MIIEEDIYLEHFGVKGMRWGVRKKREPTTIEQLNANTAMMYPHLKKTVKKANKKGVLVIGSPKTSKKTTIQEAHLTVSNGSLVVKKVIDQNGGLKLTNKPAVNTQAAEVKKILRGSGPTPVNALRPTS